MPAITGGHICSGHDQILLSIHARFSGLGIPIFPEIACFQDKNLKKST